MTLKTREKRGGTLIIACGALAREIDFLRRANGWTQLRVRSVPAELHNTPEHIPEAVRSRVREAAGEFDRIFCAYADCGTGGRLDAVLDEFGIERLPGAHCYRFFAGEKLFQQLSREEPGTFYLTDFLAEHFERLVMGSLGLDCHPELFDDYFKSYRRLVYLSQRSDCDELFERAREAAAKLGLAFEHRPTGYGDLETSLRKHV